jgi:hypothetical protein
VDAQGSTLLAPSVSLEEKAVTMASILKLLLCI